MARQTKNVTAKTWTKHQAKQCLSDINNELTAVLKGGDLKTAIDAIKKHIKHLEDLHKPPNHERDIIQRKLNEELKPPKPKLPADIRKKIQSVITKNKELLTVLQQWDPSLTLKDNKASQKRKGAKPGK